jgi:hypothetical protein
MARTEITPDMLIIRMEGVDKLCALKGELQIPRAHVLGAEPTEAEDGSGSMAFASARRTSRALCQPAGSTSTVNASSVTFMIPSGRLPSVALAHRTIPAAPYGSSRIPPG